MIERAHAAVVLAAGGSRRLGQCKQLLCRDGETMVHRAVRLASETIPHRLLVVVGAYRAEIIAAVHEFPYERVENDEWEQGLASSLQNAGRALDGFDGPILILGCDQPALELTHLQHLLSQAARAASRCAATAFDDALGIPAVVTQHLLREGEPLHGDHGLRHRLRTLRPDQLARVDAPSLRFDLDTAADVRAAIARGLLDEPSQR